VGAYADRVAPASVLVVDDDRAVRQMLERTLRAEGYATTGASDGGAALAAIERSAPDLVVLDVTMPGVDGLAVTRRLRSRGLALPVLLLTARDAVGDRVAGLDAGADDYLVKPFASEELLARVRALLRRGAAPERLVFADVELDVERRAATRSGRDLRLTPREADLLELLLRTPRGVVSRETALRAVWGEGVVTGNSVERYVAYLRRKLGDPPLIETVRGVGYALRR
jgi:two-component system response regulator MprA